MARSIHKLNSRLVASISDTGRHSDGGGLYLRVFNSGSKSWVYMWNRGGKRREMGLGSLDVLSLKEARDKAAECRKMVSEGLDPIEERQIEDEPTFLKCAMDYIAAHEKRWKNEKHRYQWRQTLTVYAKPLHKLKVSEVTTPHILAVLKPIWNEKHETATRLRSRIEAVLDYATAMGWRTGMNPAIWRGNLKSLLPQISKSKRVVHHKSLPYQDMPAFMAELREREGITPRLMEFAILTACRSIEAREAVWSEFNLDVGTWTIPKARMKAGQEHIVSLSGRALEIVKELHVFKRAEYVFPHPDSLKPLSVNAPRALLKRMGYDVTFHGFRATFKSWATDKTHVQREVIEMALAHKIGSNVEQAYLRSTALDKRRELMERWSQFCHKDSDNEVVKIYG